MPQRPRFVLGDGDTVETQTFDDYPENAPSDQFVVEARFGVLGMVITPTCHVSEGEKDENIVAVVPVQALNLVAGDIEKARSIRAGKNVPLHVFHLPPTGLGGGILGFHGAALLDRPASMLKDNLRDYRRLGLFVESRIELRRRSRASGRVVMRVRPSSSRCDRRSRTVPSKIWSRRSGVTARASHSSPGLGPQHAVRRALPRRRRPPGGVRLVDRAIEVLGELIRQHPSLQDPSGSVRTATGVRRGCSSRLVTCWARTVSPSPICSRRAVGPRRRRSCWMPPRSSPPFAPPPRARRTSRGVRSAPRSW
jgi:hypothetical protein